MVRPACISCVRGGLVDTRLRRGDDGLATPGVHIRDVTSRAVNGKDGRPRQTFPSVCSPRRGVQRDRDARSRARGHRKAMTATALRGAALYVVLALLAACATKDPRAAPDPVADLRAYDTCAATAAPWEKAREEVIQFFRERVPLATAVDVLLITAQTAAGERVLIPT